MADFVGVDDLVGQDELQEVEQLNPKSKTVNMSSLLKQINKSIKKAGKQSKCKWSHLSTWNSNFDLCTALRRWNWDWRRNRRQPYASNASLHYRWDYTLQATTEQWAFAGQCTRCPWALAWYVRRFPSWLLPAAAWAGTKCQFFDEAPDSVGSWRAAPRCGVLGAANGCDDDSENNRSSKRWKPRKQQKR